MGFRINSNIDALVANGHMKKSQMGIAKSIERLSSGLRINRGADDAAGLTISEKIRGQIRGLNRAIGNSQDGISLIQTAEGALNEDASILNRLRELSIQAQADSLTANDRLEIQKEVDQLVTEVDRISKTTEFNTKKLLDGTANALVSTNSVDLIAHQTGAAGRLAAGDYEIDVRLQDSGEKQVQFSNILRDRNTDNVAGLSTKLVDLESFYDNDGNDVLSSPQTITIRGNGGKVDVTVSSDLTLQEFSANMEDAITKDVDDGGLGLRGSTFAFDALRGQIVFESGKAGETGEISLAQSEDLNRALGFQITTDSTNAAFKVVSTQVGVATPEIVSANTTTDRGTGVVEGLDLQFQLASEARFDGTVAGTEAITIGDTNLVFTFHDTNAGVNGQAATSVTAGVSITLTRSRTYTLGSIQTIVNSTIRTANVTTGTSTAGQSALVRANTSTNFQVPGVTASFDGYNLQLTSSIKGTSGTISVTANNIATDLLGIQTGKVIGNAGKAAVITGSKDISEGITFSGTGVATDIMQIQVFDGDFNTNGNGSSLSGPVASGGSVSFSTAVNVSATSILDTFNNYFAAGDIKAAATLTSDGKLEIRSTETGGDSKVSITLTDGSSLADLGFVNNQNNVGTGGNAAVFSGNTDESVAGVGFTLASALLFKVTDKDGAASNTIQFGTNGINTTESFTISKEAITSILQTSTLKTTDVDFRFDAANRLDFFSNSTGEDARIVLSTGNNSARETIGRVSFGIDFGQAKAGIGKTNFDLHVADRSLTFQIGANKSQHLNFEVINTSAEALGLKGLDITNIRNATSALGSIDDAIQVVSSERSKLGSLQNRLTSTMSNLTVTSTNLSSFESSIRDVDLATETVDFTRNQILIQAGTAQLAQAKALPQQALQLLG
jgi:flagellin